MTMPNADEITADYWTMRARCAAAESSLRAAANMARAYAHAMLDAKNQDGTLTDTDRAMHLADLDQVDEWRRQSGEPVPRAAPAEGVAP